MELLMKYSFYVRHGRTSHSVPKVKFWQSCTKKGVPRDKMLGDGLFIEEFTQANFKVIISIVRLNLSPGSSSSRLQLVARAGSARAQAYFYKYISFQNLLGRTIYFPEIISVETPMGLAYLACANNTHV